MQIDRHLGSRLKVEQEIRNPLLLSGHPSAKDTYQALEGLLQDQVVRSACINEARGILKTMMAHRKRLGELEQQYGRIVPEADAGGVLLVAEGGHAQSATALEDLPVDVVCELMKREFDLGRASLHVYDGAIRQARLDICGLRRPIPWVEFLASKGMLDDASRAQMMPQNLAALEEMMKRLLAERDELLEQVQDREAAKAEEEQARDRVKDWQDHLQMGLELGAIMQSGSSPAREDQDKYHKFRQEL